jgi:hypothetical protein
MLDVYLHSDPIGHLIQDDGGDMVSHHAGQRALRRGRTATQRLVALLYSG